MDDDTPWRAWVHAALVGDLCAHLVGTRDAIENSRKVALDLGNMSHVWTLEHYTTATPPADATKALTHARTVLSDKALDALRLHYAPRPSVSKCRRRLIAHTDDLLTDVDAPAALAAWDLLHPGATKAEIEDELLVGSVQQALKGVFSPDHAWVGRRVNHLKRQARGLATRKRAHRRKPPPAVVSSK